MSAPNPSPPEQPHRNHRLFSDHYLNAAPSQRPGEVSWRAGALGDGGNGAHLRGDQVQ